MRGVEYCVDVEWRAEDLSYIGSHFFPCPDLPKLLQNTQCRQDLVSSKE